MNLPTITSLNYSMRCRSCNKDHDLKLGRTTTDFEELEVLVHSDLDDRGWVDGQCPTCVDAQAGTNPDRDYEIWEESRIC